MKEYAWLKFVGIDQEYETKSNIAYVSSDDVFSYMNCVFTSTNSANRCVYWTLRRLTLSKADNLFNLVSEKLQEMGVLATNNRDVKFSANGEGWSFEGERLDKDAFRVALKWLKDIEPLEKKLDAKKADKKKADEPLESLESKAEKVLAEIEKVEGVNEASEAEKVEGVNEASEPKKEAKKAKKAK